MQHLYDLLPSAFFRELGLLSPLDVHSRVAPSGVDHAAVVPELRSEGSLEGLEEQPSGLVKPGFLAIYRETEGLYEADVLLEELDHVDDVLCILAHAFREARSVDNFERVDSVLEQSALRRTGQVGAGVDAGRGVEHLLVVRILSQEEGIGQSRLTRSSLPYDDQSDGLVLDGAVPTDSSLLLHESRHLLNLLVGHALHDRVGAEVVVI